MRYVYRLFVMSGMAACAIGMLFIVSTTLAAEKPACPVRFAVIGDRTGSAVPGVYEQMIAEIQRLRPDFLMTVGDMIEGYTEDTAQLITQWTDYKRLLSAVTMPVHFTPGNHDILNDAQDKIYRREIGQPYYSFDYRDVHLVVMQNTRWETAGELPAEQMQWLADDLRKSADARCTFVFMHKPFWYGGVAAGQPDTLHALFRRYGVDAVFTGHFHDYFTGSYDGITYTSMGSSGGQADPGPTGLLYHFLWVTVDEAGVTVAPIKIDAVRPWDELTAEARLTIGRIQQEGIDCGDGVTLEDDLTVKETAVKVLVRNLSPGFPLQDSLVWNIPPGWQVAPSVMPVALPTGQEQAFTFHINCAGPVYPLPAVTVDFPYAEGKTTPITVPLRITRQVICRRAPTPPVIDGELNEPLWTNPVTSLFSPDGGPVTIDPTEFFFAYDEENLYLAARCTERVIDQLAAAVTDHDGMITAEDCIGFFLQPDRGQPMAYQVYVNPLGTIFDQKLTMDATGYMQADRAWDGAYAVMPGRGVDFWVVEAAIPLVQFGTIGKPGTKWGINFRRKQKRSGTAGDWQAPIDYNPKTFGMLIMK
jgi:UDP-2,3-diacylglucosamine pyrophosphatase LpxH